MGATGPAATVLVPVKGFAAAKARLAPVLDPPARADLARRTAEHVVRAAAPLPVAVVCDDEEVAAWAEGLGADVLRATVPGLDPAVAEGLAVLTAREVGRVLVVAGDLPLAAGLADLAGTAGDPVTIVPDRRDDGTNVLVVPAACGFRVAYGPGSFSRHAAEAARLGLGPDVRRPAALTLDLDEPADLEVLAERTAVRSCA